MGYSSSPYKSLTPDKSASSEGLLLSYFMLQFLNCYLNFT